jgi:hypothetical protein
VTLLQVPIVEGYMQPYILLKVLVPLVTFLLELLLAKERTGCRARDWPERMDSTVL